MPPKRNPNAPKAIDIVTEHWGHEAPAWVKQLAAFCDETSQAAAARKIALSPSLVNMVLKGNYTGSLDNVKSRVEAARGMVSCPIIGDISFAECHANQTKPYSPGNHVAVKLFRACRTCPNNLSCKGKSNEGISRTADAPEVSAPRDRWQRKS